MLDDAALTKRALDARGGDSRGGDARGGDARGGDARAASELVRLTYPQVWRLLAVLTDRRVAEDLTQETYARAFRSLPGFRAESSVRAWVLAIARRVAADHLRYVRSRPRLVSGVAPDEPEATAPGDLAER
jgi:RNA polymerase sigma-70 factor, ECF subfamily